MILWPEIKYRKRDDSSAFRWLPTAYKGLLSSVNYYAFSLAPGPNEGL
jgi:hypothetical protein